MNSENQQQIWDNIAEEWHKFKEIPSEFSKEFLNKCYWKCFRFRNRKWKTSNKNKKWKNVFS